MSLVLGHAGIDQLHAEWDAVLAEMRLAQGRHAMATALRGLIDHLEHHFGAEEAWMRDSAFGPMGCHQREHSQVLEVVREVLRRFEAGDEEIAGRLAQELPHWFSVHASTMDAVLAEHLEHLAGRA